MLLGGEGVSIQAAQLVLVMDVLCGRFNPLDGKILLQVRGWRPRLEEVKFHLGCLSSHQAKRRSCGTERLCQVTAALNQFSTSLGVQSRIPSPPLE